MIYEGSKRQCAEEGCQFLVMYCHRQWYHIDTHGIIPDHFPVPVLIKGDEDGSTPL